jgi:hypothetical protein
MHLLWTLLLMSLGTLVQAATPVNASTVSASSNPNLAFYYAANPPWDELQAFDWVVVEPDHVPDPKRVRLPHTRLAAYVSLGEAHPSRSYASRIPKSWLRGDNRDWGSQLIDQTTPEWPEFFATQVIDPLWKQGYRSFFIDTLDSYHRFTKTDAERAAQEAGMVAVIRELARRHPEVRLIYNRGFEILPQTRSLVDAVVAESLFQQYDARTRQYSVVKTEDREWLLGQLRKVREQYQLPVVAIDYVAPNQRELARQTAKRLMALGITPWVTTPDLNTLGVGAIEVMPRKILVVHTPVADEFALRISSPVRFSSLPLNHLGYVPEFVDLQHLPELTLVGRYAGIVVWLDNAPAGLERKALLDWLSKQQAEGMTLALVNEIEYLLETPLGRTLGLNTIATERNTAPIQIEQQDAMLGFETSPRPPADSFYPLALANGKPLLSLKRGNTRQVAAAIAPWGGYVLAPYTVLTLPGGESDRWIIDPFAFFKQALKLPDMPVPDVTTETGRRMFMVHMDGDGFVSRSELPGRPLAGAVVRDRIVNTYKVPMTISVIEAELSAQGLYPDLSLEAERIASDIFRAPNVAIATHSYSHPFVWRKPAKGEDEKGMHLNVPGYRFNLEREVAGSVKYINSRLAPPGKKVELFFWTGDCIPDSDAVAETVKAGLLNLNGGDTVATRSHPTLTRVEGLGLARGANFQVFAPNQNENVYTNGWLGPFYGFERVIETFEFTEKPRRLKPINIYFHTYLTTKRAGMQSFDKVMTYALKQDITPVYVSDYARKVLDFQHMVIARSAEGWRIRGAGQLHSLRLPASLGLPDVAKSRAVAGYKPGATESYVHLVGDASVLVLQTAASLSPRLDSANAKVSAFEAQAGTYRWTLEGEVPLAFSLANAQGCRVRVGGQDIAAAHQQAGLSHYVVSSHAARPLEAICQ